METVLGSCRSFAAAYIDDIIVFSDSWEVNLYYLKTVLEALRV